MAILFATAGAATAERTNKQRQRRRRGITHVVCDFFDRCHMYLTDSEFQPAFRVNEGGFLSLLTFFVHNWNAMKRWQRVQVEGVSNLKYISF